MTTSVSERSMSGSRTERDGEQLHGTSVTPVRRLRARKEFRFFAALWHAAPGLAGAWWIVLILRGLLPAGLAVTTGILIGAVQHDHSLAAPLTAVGVLFVLYQVLTPLHVA